jgi:hypothetical protein
MKSNTMYVNGREEEWTDDQMRDWFEDHCDALTQLLCNRNATLHKLSKEYRDLQQAYTNEMLRNAELSEQLKRTDDEEK